MTEAIIDKAQTESPPKTAYISAPISMDTTYVRAVLEKQGVKTFSPDELDLPGQNLSDIVREGIQRADLVIGVIDASTRSNLVFYELGFAQALNKPTLVFMTVDASPSPWSASGIPWFRFDPGNPAGVDFGISQMLKVPHHGPKTPRAPSKRTRPLGPRADELLTQLHAAGDNITAIDLERIIAQAIRESGVTSVSLGGENRVDMAVWSDDVSPWVSNPLPVEVRLELSHTSDVNRAVELLLHAMTGGNLSWGLLIYLRAELNIDDVVNTANIMCESAEQFLDGMREKSFGELIRSLRNKRAHGRG